MSGGGTAGAQPYAAQCTVYNIHCTMHHAMSTDILEVLKSKKKLHARM